MIHILLVILKCTGLLLAFLLLLVMLMGSIIIWVPIRYKVQILYEDKASASAKITWMLRMLSVTLRYDSKGMDIGIRILGISLQRWKDKWLKLSLRLSKWKKSWKRFGSKEKRELKIAEKKKSNHRIQIEKKRENTKQDGMFPAQYDELEVEDENQENKTLKDIPKRQKKKRKIEGLIGKIKRMFQRLRSKLDKLKYTTEKIYDKIKKAKQFIMNKDNQAALWLVKNRALRILLHMLPKKLKGNVHFGTGDPSTTGQILGVYSMCYPFLKDRIYVVPEFEEVIFEMDLEAKGRIRIFTLLKHAFLLYRDKDIKRLIKQYRK